LNLTHMMDLTDDRSRKLGLRLKLSQAAIAYRR
jgi:hypothetical protein